MSDNTQLVSGSINFGENANVWDVFADPTPKGHSGDGWPPATNPMNGDSPTVRHTVYDIDNSVDLPIINPAAITTTAICGAFAAVGTTDITVTSSNSPYTLAPGQYRDVTAQNGTTLILQAGVYTVRRFITGQHVNVYTVPGTIINIWGDNDGGNLDFRLLDDTYFGAQSGPAAITRVCVSDALRPGGLANNNSVGFGQDGTFYGIVNAPSSDLNLGNNWTHYGRFLAKTISSDWNVNINWDCCDSTPTPSPSPSATPSPSSSATPSPTPSATPSPTPSATPSQKAVCDATNQVDSNGAPIINRDINSYALFAYDDLLWKGGQVLNSGNWGHIYDGNVGVNNAAPGVGSPFNLRFGTDRNGYMSPGSQLVGDAVLNNTAGSYIDYLFANSVNTGFATTPNHPNPATTRGNYPFTTPIVVSPPSLPFTAYAALADFQAAAGANYVAPVIVPKNGSYTLDPTKWYGGISLGDGSTLIAGAGTFRIWDFPAVGKGVTFQVTDATVLDVDVHMNPNDGFRFGVGTNSLAHLNIGGAGYNWQTTFVTHFSNNAIFYGQYFAPTAWVDLGATSTYYGRIWARRISGDPNDNVYCVDP
jgi:hypothetical protein